MTVMTMKNNAVLSNKKWFLILHIELLLFSFGGVCSKMAAGHDFLSFWFIFWYALVILNLGIYAIVWQQIIKHLPLNTAYANKAVTIAWGILWGALFFGEIVTWTKLIGAAIVIVGVIVVVMADE